MSARVAVVGAGIAGLACGARLRDAGLAVTLFDKGRQPGGRLATRATDVGTFDHGAASFAVRNAGGDDEGFGAEVARWAAAGVVAPDPALPGAWMGVPTMNALPRALAATLDVRQGVRVAAIGRDGRRWHVLDAERRVLGDGAFDAVVVAAPAEQAVPLLAGSPALAQVLASVHSEACWAVMAAWTTGAPVLARPLLGPLCHRPDSTAPLGPLACVRHENGKPSRDASGTQRWVLTATPYWSAHNLELDAAEVVRHLLDDLARRSVRALGAPVHAVAHRWRYAEVPQPVAAPCGWDAERALGACGDAWCADPGASSVERAWRSGRALAGRVIATLTTPAR
ncbi:NAD(P)-binding protein [Calidifontimicrobium sp. SYSU G02091]|uniref:NAD(P)/FAD-dependent oxidoreductase n=1 Tax=Calidifontimicrobium sp. SYSU G02091 TaxID=2926421 RepID=UPI001F537F8D|nr:FAD-dependent oxidoreductase [Calidifontimicrobium sp. SYSU G02091]MCI1192535.1 NAD(P)-binding protein [Calidifontimicrobium sp. SYSU G02091]